jgi:hypothetical protein
MFDNEHFIRTRSFSGWTHTLLVSRATKCPGENCSCDCHLQGRALPVMQRLTVAQEQRLELFIKQVLGAMLKA